MTSYLQKKLKSLMDEKKLNITAVEKAAGLKKDAVRNVVYGKSKNPSMSLVSSIAVALDCSLYDLIESDKKKADVLKEIDEPLDWNKNLLQDSINCVQIYFEKYGLTLDFYQAMAFVKEVYSYSLQKGKLTQIADINFAEWLIKGSIKH